MTKLADLGASSEENPDGTDVDSDPTGLARSGRASSTPTRAATHERGPQARQEHRRACSGGDDRASPAGPAGFLADSVPTDVVKGPGGAWYVSQLVGFPFEKGSSSIWRIVPGTHPRSGRPA